MQCVNHHEVHGTVEDAISRTRDLPAEYIEYEEGRFQCGSSDETRTIDEDVSPNGTQC